MILQWVCDTTTEWHATLKIQTKRFISQCYDFPNSVDKPCIGMEWESCQCWFDHLFFSWVMFDCHNTQFVVKKDVLVKHDLN